MTVPVAVAVHLRCHKSTSPSWLRISRINDGVNKTFPLFVGHFVMQGREHCSARNVANCRIIGQLSYALALSVQHLRPGHQIALREGDWHVLNSEAPARVAPTGQTQGELA